MPQRSAPYKSLARVERAFGSLKTVGIHRRQIFHWTAPWERAHVLLCVLGYHVEHPMGAGLAPMLYDETDHEAAAQYAPASSRCAPTLPGASTLNRRKLRNELFNKGRIVL
jgi:hypothetical protein